MQGKMELKDRVQVRIGERGQLNSDHLSDMIGALDRIQMIGEKLSKKVPKDWEVDIHYTLDVGYGAFEVGVVVEGEQMEEDKAVEVG